MLKKVSGQIRLWPLFTDNEGGVLALFQKRELCSVIRVLNGHLSLSSQRRSHIVSCGIETFKSHFNWIHILVVVLK